MATPFKKGSRVYYFVRRGRDAHVVALQGKVTETSDRKIVLMVGEGEHAKKRNVWKPRWSELMMVRECKDVETECLVRQTQDKVNRIDELKKTLEGLTESSEASETFKGELLKEIGRLEEQLVGTINKHIGVGSEEHTPEETSDEHA